MNSSRNGLFSLFICFNCFVLAGHAEVRVAEFEGKAAYNVGNYGESHNVGTCDSGRTKRRAHLLSSHLKHKKLDNELINRCFSTCEFLAETDPAQAVSCIRECNDREREQRGQGWEKFGSMASVLTGAAMFFAK